MRQIKAILVVGVLAVAAPLLLANTGASQELNNIQGLVLDEAGNPVADVWIRVYRGIDEIARGYTAQDGRYQVEFDRGDPITTIRYDHLLRDTFERRHPTIVSNLSGVKDHNITKVMGDRVGQAYDEYALLEMLSAYERLYFIDATRELSPGTIRGEIYDRYKENIWMMKHVDPYTEQRLIQIRELYEPQ